MSGGQRGRPGRRPVLSSAGIVLATAALSFAAAGGNVLPGDVRLTRAIQSIAFNGVARLERLGYFLGSVEGIVAVGVAAILLLLVTRHPAEALLVAGALLLRSSNPWIKALIDSPRPTPDLVRVQANATGDPGSLGFPSGHVMGAVLIYGALLYIAQRTLRPARRRLTTQALCALAILLTALSRIYSGAHWPTDVLGGLLWGGTLLLFAAIIHRTFRGYRVAS